MARLKRDVDDGELVDRVVRGDEDAFAFLVEKYHPRVFRLVRGIVGDWHRSEDVCQEIYTLIFRKLGSFRGRSRLSTWIFRVAVNASLKSRKRRWRLETETLEAVDDLASPPDRAPAELESEEVFRKLLAPLPERLRTAVVLREQLGLSYAEMAQVLGCTRGAVEQRLHRAMVALRDIWRNSQWQGS